MNFNRRNFIKTFIATLTVGTTVVKSIKPILKDTPETFHLYYSNTFYGGNAGGGKTESLYEQDDSFYKYLKSNPRQNSIIDNIEIPEGY